MNQGYTEAYFDFGLAKGELLSKWRLIVLVCFVGLLLGFAANLIFPRAFKARAAFLPAAPSSSTQAADLMRGLSGGLGTTLGFVGSASTAAEVNMEMLRTTNLLRRALAQTFRTGPGGGTSYQQAFGFAGSDKELQTARAVEHLRERLDVSVDRTNGLVRVEFSDSDPELAYRFVVVLLNELNIVNTSFRQAQATSVRVFLSQRILEARYELEQAENALAGFRARNLRFERAPKLSLEEARLERRVRLSEATYQTLVQQYELARIDEARDTPTLSIVEPPSIPVIPSGLGPIAFAVIGGVGTSLTAAAFVARKALLVGSGRANSY